MKNDNALTKLADLLDTLYGFRLAPDADGVIIHTQQRVQIYHRQTGERAYDMEEAVREIFVDLNKPN